MKLTENQWDALLRIAEGRAFSIHFGTGESLRRRGLLERDTTHVLRRIHAFQSGEVLQYECDPARPYVHHEWEITKAGLRFLSGKVGAP